METRNKNYCVIMAGGVGSRFWPLSTADLPKQFIDILGTGKTFIRQTYERFLPLVPTENFLILTNKRYKNIVLKELPELQESQILCEPAMRNTAPCILYAAFRIAASDSQANMIVAPSDHLVTGEQEFINVISDSLDFVSQADRLMTIGIRPTRPETGYGYIQVNDKEGDNPITKVKTFTEKPNLELARQFVKSGEFRWNSGIFIWSVPSILKAFAEHQPHLYDLFKLGIDIYNTDAEQSFIDANYGEAQNISIDYGIMEHADNTYVHSASFGWSDVGTWGSLFENSGKDSSNNSIVGQRTFCYDTENSIVRIDDKKIAVIEGLKDYIVIDNNEVLLICSKNSEQKIKMFIDDVKKSQV